MGRRFVVTGNPHRGEVEIPADGATWTLRYTTNAVAKLERAFDLPWTQVVARLFQGDRTRVGDLVRFFAGGLWHHHRDMTEERAADIIDIIGQETAVAAMFEALRLSFPAPKEGAAGDPPPAGG